MTRTLKNHPYAQARIITHNDGSVSLYSYNTLVITINHDGWLEITGTYSRTTIRHIGWFMRELYNLSYQFAKDVYVTGHRANVFTGEVDL